jgi:hypothetical protein
MIKIHGQEFKTDATLPSFSQGICGRLDGYPVSIMRFSECIGGDTHLNRRYKLIGIEVIKDLGNGIGSVSRIIDARLAARLFE